MFTLVTTKEQIATVASLAQEIWEQHFTPIIGAGQVAYMLERFQSAEAIGGQIGDGMRYYLVEVGGVSVGYFAFSIKGTMLSLSKVYLRAACRGKGYGKAVFQCIEQHAVAANVHIIELHVNKDNDDSIAFYKTRGFAVVAEPVNPIGGGYVMDDYSMQKSLRAPSLTPELA